jgi:Zn-dependent M28 family amino/carboxypeptidase
MQICALAVRGLFLSLMRRATPAFYSWAAWVVFYLLAMPVYGNIPGNTPAAQQGPDPAIAAALGDVSPARVQATIEKLVSFHTRSTLSSGVPPAGAPSGQGIVAAREWIRGEFERYSEACGGCLEVKTDGFTEPAGDRVPKPTEIVNVYAVLRGTDAEEAKRIVLVTGHYDSRNSDNGDTVAAAPGANDDASGTAVSLECARVLSRLKFPATIVFLSVAGEEQGLYGSTHFAKMVKEKMAKEQGWQLGAVLNNDIVGGDRSAGQNPDRVRVFSEGIPLSASADDVRRIRGLGGESDSASRQIARYIAETATIFDTGLKPALVFRLDRYLRGGDHSAFNTQGFAGVRFTEYRENYNHQHQNVRTENGIEYGDLPKFVDYDYVAKVARLNAATLASLASAPAPPGNVRLQAKELQNDSTLTWDAVPRAANYEVLWRDTTSPTWDHSEPAGGETHATLKMSKDNVIFAVRSVDASGHRSLAVVPQPEH